MKSEDQAEQEQDVVEEVDQELAGQVSRKLIQEALDTLLGRPEAEVVKQLQDAGWRVRVRVREAESFAGTMDFRMDRVNLHVQNGVITKIYVG
jgi:hypothetical protein